MKDKSLKVNYFRMENGGIQVFIGKDNKMLVDFILFPDGNMWLELGDKNKGHLTVYIVSNNLPYPRMYDVYGPLLGWDRARFVTFFDGEFEKFGSPYLDGFFFPQYRNK